MKTTHETRVIVSGSFARAMKALASFARNRYTLTGEDKTYDIDGSWFTKGPPVKFEDYHVAELRPYNTKEED